MGKRKKKYIPKSFESDNSLGKADTHASLYRSMILSKPYNKLTANQKHLYTLCKSELYGKSKNDLEQFNEYFREKGINKHDHPEYFTMNWGKVKKGGLYDCYSNTNSFRTDMNALIEHGFVDCILCGADTRSKSLYKLSGRWRFYGTDKFSVPENIKTISMTGSRKKKE